MFSLAIKNNQMKKAKKEKVRKMLTLSGGSLGREKRSYVRGQVLIRETKYENAEKIDIFTGLYPGEEEKITPYKDIKLNSLRKPDIFIEIRDQVTKSLVYSARFNGDKNGFFKHEIEKPLNQGNYEVYFFVQGEVNLFHFHETTIVNGDRFLLTGKTRLKILSEKYNSIITTSDIDQTYLATPLETVKGKIFTLFETPAEKKQIPGMDEFYKNLRKCTTGSPLAFISASPHFYRRTFFAKFNQDKIDFESLHLKYLKGTLQELAAKFRSTFSTPSDLFKKGWDGKLRELKKSTGKYYRSLFDQVAYKLAILLHNRIYHPTAAKEILLGDDTESDFLVYSLYQLIITGGIQGDELEDFLLTMEFKGRSAITKNYAMQIRLYAEECLKAHGKTNSVKTVLINHTDSMNSQKKLYAVVQQALPFAIRISMIKDFKLFILTEGSLGFAAVLHSQGVVTAEAVFAIAKKIAADEIMDKNKIFEILTNLDFLNLGGKTRKVMEETVKHAFHL